MALIREPQLVDDLAHPHAAVSQTCFHQFQLVAGDILLEALASVFSEIFMYVAGGNRKVIGYRFRLQAFGGMDVFVDIPDDLRGMIFPDRGIPRIDQPDIPGDDGYDRIDELLHYFPVEFLLIDVFPDHSVHQRGDQRFIIHIL